MHKIFTQMKEPKLAKWVVLGLAVVIAIVLGLAAWGKFFSPVENFKVLHRWVSIYEIVFICLLLSFRKYILMWLASAVMFAGWTGYSIFWFYLELPCHCMGSFVEMTSGCTVVIDILFFVMSLFAAFLLGAPRKLLFAVVVVSLFFIFCGHILAEAIFFKNVLRMPWSLFYTR